MHKHMSNMYIYIHKNLYIIYTYMYIYMYIYRHVHRHLHVHIENAAGYFSTTRVSWLPERYLCRSSKATAFPV